jgi:1-deoxy-D-xylulose-5-phosphate reductoisomerase
MKKIVILGSTGSLGTQTLEVLEKFQEKFKIIALACDKNENLIKSQAKKFAVPQENIFIASKQKSQKELLRLATLKDADIVVNVLSGVSGIFPAIASLKAKKTLLLGNKESLVADGDKVMKLAKNATLIPLDSEHNSVHEILKKFPNKKIKNIFLSCSGGPFWGKTAKELENITPEKALAHPKWNMGAKISVESATLINKGLEIVEAFYLFSLPLSKIHAFINPDCLIHAIVEFTDLTSYAYVSKPDMREHIENALLEAINKTAKRTIKKIPKSLYESNIIKTTKTLPLKGISIVLSHFKNGKMKPFLSLEEKTIQDFLQNKITFPQIFLRLH